MNTEYRHPRYDAMDANYRSDAAYHKHIDFFGSPEHKEKIRKVVKILKNSHNGGKIYVTHRENNWDPFTAVKTTGTFKFSSPADLETNYYGPLRAMGVEITNGRNEGSVIHRIF